ncbi:alkylhydroperoxidase domain protein [Erwinia sp.]|uniref:alkylhydroperoxidase domain protein n=1 Tax=Erwinia citreus TaxID=558 RepID=UPI003C71A527
MTSTNDLLASLADIAPDSDLAQARHTREAATRHAQGSYEVIFTQQDEDFPLAERFALAALVAGWNAQPSLQAHYQQQAGSFGNTNRHERAKDYAHLLTFEPVNATPAHLQALQDAGWTARGIVTLSQLISFINFQSRLLAGLQLLQGKESAAAPQPVVAGKWHDAAKTLRGKTAPTKFTQQELGWEPWLAAKPLAEFSAEEQVILARFGHSESDYFRLLARNLPVLEQRTLTDKGIFFTSGGLPRADRELAAAVVSKVNGCIFCASVHARKASQLSKQSESVETLIGVAPGASLSAGQSERWAAIIDLSAALSVTPQQATLEQISALQKQGLDTLSLLDVIQSSAFFAWANRLMLTLGEPFLPSDA